MGDIGAHPDRFDPEASRSYYDRAIALAEPRGFRPIVAHSHLGLATLDRRAGRREEATRHRAIAVTLYREMAMRFWLEQAEARFESA
jgi:hypothetical protein